MPNLTEEEWNQIPEPIRSKLRADEAAKQAEIEKGVEEGVRKWIEINGPKVAQSLSSAAPQPQDMMLCPTHPEDAFSHVLIDSTLSDLHSKDELEVIRFIYSQLGYGSKLPYFEGRPMFAQRGLNFTEPNIENIIVGECQSGKSAEAAWTAWCSFYIVGCLPVIFVRNSGGKTQGREDMKKAIETLNSRIQTVLKDALAGNSLMQHVAEDRLDRWISSEHFCLRAETEEKNIVSHFRGQGKVLIVLQNPTHLRRLTEPYFRGGQKWFSATVIEKQGNQYKVAFCDNAKRVVLPLADVRTSEDKVIPAGRNMVGSKVKAKMPEHLRKQDSLMQIMTKLYGNKRCADVDKVRMIFIMDEADLSVGNPKRSGNKTADMLFHSKCPILSSEFLGMREYVFGSVYITATPQALFICDWKATQQLPPGAAAGDSSEEESDSDSIEGGDGNDVEAGATDQAAGDSDGVGSSSDCNSPSGSAAASAAPPAAPPTQPVSGGSCSRRPLRSNRGQSQVRFLKPHVVFADRPDNYIAYDAAGWPANGKRIERRVLEERHLKVMSKYQIYKTVWISQHGLEDRWKDMERQATGLREGVEVDHWPNFTIVQNQLTRRLTIKAPSAKQRARSTECQETFDMVDSIYRQTRESQSGQSIWDQDGDAIEVMLYDMLLDEEAEYRHALIISSNTKATQKQAALQKDMIHHFRNAADLAVATYNSVSGIAVMFTNSMHTADPRLMDRAVASFRSEVQSLCETKGDRMREAVSADKGGRRLLLKGQPIEVMYEGIKSLASRVVVITGEIGGRGVAYHDLRHERILTDMYTAQEVCNDRIVTQHGELLVQVLGRLNTIETFTQRDLPCPPVRLWASQSVHDLHKHYLEEIRALCDAVQEHKDYQQAFKTRPQWTTGQKPCGEKLQARMSRPSFAKAEPQMRSGEQRPVPLPAKRHREPMTSRDRRRRTFPKESKCTCQERLPHCAGEDDVDGGEYGSAEAYVWRPAVAGGRPWSADEHTAFEVRVPRELLCEAKAKAYVDQISVACPSEGRREGLFIDAHADQGVADPIFRFKTLRAARGLVLAGAAGEKEARLFQLKYHDNEENSDSSYRTMTESEMEDSDWEAEEGERRPSAPRRRLNLNSSPGRESAGASAAGGSAEGPAIPQEA